MKPITYWIQNEAIDQLVEKYGSTLEKLIPEHRRALIRALTMHEYWSVGHTQLDKLEALHSLTQREKDLLIEAIAASLTQTGNPWVENARANVAIAQKEGTPAY